MKSVLPLDNNRLFFIQSLTQLSLSIQNALKKRKIFYQRRKFVSKQGGPTTALGAIAMPLVVVATWRDQGTAPKGEPLSHTCGSCRMWRWRHHPVSSLLHPDVSRYDWPFTYTVYMYKNNQHRPIEKTTCFHEKCHFSLDLLGVWTMQFKDWDWIQNQDQAMCAK